MEILDRFICAQKSKTLVSKHAVASFAMVLNSINRIIVHGRPFITELFRFGASVDKFATTETGLLNDDCLDDLVWWRHTITACAERSYVPPPAIPSEPPQLFCSDASNTGCAGVIADQAWSIRFSPEETEYVKKHHIAQAELYAEYINLWGHRTVWANHAINLFCDNTNAVDAVRNGTSDDIGVLRILKRIEDMCMTFDISLSLTWFSTHENHVADNFSRGKSVVVFQGVEVVAKSPVDAAGAAPPPLLSLVR